MIDLTDHEKHVQSIEIIKVRAALCRWQESQRQDKSRSTFKSKKLMNSSEDLAENSEENTTDYFFLICRSTQCSFCLDEKRKFYKNWTFKYCELNKMMKHVQKMHLRKYASNDEINCKHSTCKTNSLTLSSVMTFKHHIMSANWASSVSVLMFLKCYFQTLSIILLRRFIFSWCKTALTSFFFFTHEFSHEACFMNLHLILILTMSLLLLLLRRITHLLLASFFKSSLNNVTKRVDIE